LHKVLGFAGSSGNGVDVALAFDGEAGYRFAGLGDSFDDSAGPTGLDADDDASGHVGIAAGSDQRAEMQLEVFSKLQTSIGVWKRERAFYIVADGLRAGVRQIVERENDYVIANADSPILTPIAEK
jgi:hypothetical protein